MFSKKRLIDEISKNVETLKVSKSADVEMQEEVSNKQVDDSMATENFHSIADDIKFDPVETLAEPVQI